MPRFVLFAAVLAAACSGALPEAPAVPVRGRLELEIHPMPIVAKQLEGDRWRFPFEVVLRESGGVDVEIDAIRVEVRVGPLPVLRQVWDAEEARRRGYETFIPAGGMAQYAFAPVRRVADPRLIALARADVGVEAVDRFGNRSEAVRPVTVELEDR